MTPENFIEVSFEVANKVGGIYQVIKSKNTYMQKTYGENYLTIGFYNQEKASKDFAKREEHPYSQIFNKLEEEHGIKCRYGVWKIPGEPKTILVDATELHKPVNEIKREIWEKHKIDSLKTGHDYNEPLKWSYAVAKLIQQLKTLQKGETVVQLHEWLTGPVQFYTNIPTVFTTHATVYGRALSNADNDLNKIISQEQAPAPSPEELDVKAKHQVEQASAKEADVFTTVSKTTGKETEKLLGVKPDKILPNGLNLEEFPSLGKLSNEHKEKKQRMKNFLRAYFTPYYNIDIEDDPRILFISGRYEYKNKGIDIFLEALSKINQKPGKDIFVFIFVPSDTKKEKAEVIENLSLYKELEEYTEQKITQIKETMLNAITSSASLTQKIEDSIKNDEREISNLQKNFKAKKNQKPPLTPYHLNYAPDDVLEKLKQEKLTNKEEDRIKVIFYPKYLSEDDDLLSMNYEDAVIGSSAGIFPSYYEPWGYTPVETAASGVLSVTTDMAGFGQYMLDKTRKDERKGLKVLKRKNKSDKESVNQLSDMLENIANYSKSEITERKHNARKLAQLTSWNKLAENYIEAHEEAIKETK